MNKYINADRLKAELEKRLQENADKALLFGAAFAGRTAEDNEIINLIESLQQEQQEVDLEKFTEKIKTFQGRYKHPEIVSIKGAMAFMARMFYQYPNVARQWYDNLPKVTMD